MTLGRAYPPAEQCRLCSRDLCCEGKLYVAVDGHDGAVKIGRTIQQPSARLKTYRRKGLTEVRFEHVVKAGCYFRSLKREAQAIALFAQKAEYLQRGDWYAGDVQDAIAIVNHVCRELVE